jgi:HK97 family phage portal protein
VALYDQVAQALALDQFADSPVRVVAPKALRVLGTKMQTLAERSWPDGVSPPLDVQVAALRNPAGQTAYHYHGVDSALTVPALFRAVTLISNVAGMLSMRAYRNGQPVPDEERPRLVQRPNPLVIQREHWRASAWDMAAFGECWWWVAVRDPFDNTPMSLIHRPAREVLVEPNPADELRPIIKWRGKEVDSRDMIQIVMTRKSGDLRGTGPLQQCGAAVSVAVEAQLWAANFYASGGSTTIIKSAIPLGEDPDDPDQLTEAERLALQWTAHAPNVPRVIDPAIDSVDQSGVSEGGAQMLQSRQYTNGDAARMFGIPGALLEHVESGSSLTYQNVGGLLTELVRRCLLPDYLEPMEQTMTDLLPRAWTVRFSTTDLERADLKTLSDVVNTLVKAGVISADEGRAMLGLTGSIETAPVPPSPPAAIPGPLQQRSTAHNGHSATTSAAGLGSAVLVRLAQDVRCTGSVQVRGRVQQCGRLLGKFAAPYEVACPRCKTVAALA